VSCAQLGSERAKITNPDALRIAFRRFVFPPLVAELIKELAAPLGQDPLSAYLQVSYPCKIFIETVNMRTAPQCIATSLSSSAREE